PLTTASRFSIISYARPRATSGGGRPRTSRRRLCCACGRLVSDASPADGHPLTSGGTGGETAGLRRHFTGGRRGVPVPRRHCPVFPSTTASGDRPSGPPPFG